MKSEKIGYRDDDIDLEGHLVYDPATAGTRPLVVVAHAWAGQSDLERSKAAQLAELGYAGFALDLFGKGVLGKSVEENSQLIKPFMEDRALIVRRMQAGIDAVRTHEIVDANRIAAIGFCFGGLCALDLARSGADIAGVVAFHALLNAPQGPGNKITAKILVLHGHLDPMAPQDEVVALTRELDSAGADWQIHLYGKAMHAFTNPAANDVDFGTVYDETADNRSWAAMRNFVAEIFNG